MKFLVLSAMILFSISSHAQMSRSGQQPNPYSCESVSTKAAYDFFTREVGKRCQIVEVEPVQENAIYDVHFLCIAKEQITVRVLVDTAGMSGRSCYVLNLKQNPSLITEN